MKDLDDYLALQNKIFKYFGYQEDWRVIPIDDRRQMYWSINGPLDSSQTEIIYHQDRDTVIAQDGNHYCDTLYTQRFLPKWVYEGPDFTMVAVNTHVDGNQFLAIFDNAKRVQL